jgi:hypothetical protein
MSKIVAFFEFENQNMTQETYDAVISELKAQNKLWDERRLSHVSFQKGPNWCVVDVWNSQEDLMDFGQNTLFPIFAKLKLTPPAPQVYPVHNYMGARVEELVS